MKTANVKQFNLKTKYKKKYILMQGRTLKDIIIGQANIYCSLCHKFGQHCI